MNIWLDTKYANQLQFRLERFKVKKTNPYIANFRCPLCGDSERVKSRTRGYLIEHKDRLAFKCHNCQESMSFLKFLSKVAPALADEYTMERLKESGMSQTQRMTATQVEQAMPSASYVPKKKIEGAFKITTLDPNHPARKYVDARKIPIEQQYRLFYVPAFKKWVNRMIPGKFPNEKPDEPRLVFPFMNRQGEMIGFNARSFEKDPSLRYISIMLDEDHLKVFGLDKVDQTKDVFVVEGPIDSLFIDNSVAMAGAAAADLGKYIDIEKAVFVFDNEPRNAVIVNQIRKTVDAGHRVVIFPDNIQEKDINDLVKDAGMCHEEVSMMIHKNTFSGIAALLRLKDWSKV